MRLKSEYPFGLVCGWATSMEAPHRVLPWQKVFTKTALPAVEIVASGVVGEQLAPWPLPLSYAAAQSQTADLLWAVNADHATSAYVQIARPKLASAFEGEWKYSWSS